MKISPLALGSGGFGSRIDEAESFDIIDRAIDAGINIIDTANLYGRGASEATVGEALRRNGARGRMVLATKVYFPTTDDDPNAWGNQRRHIVEECDVSLKRLQTDWIDLYQIHRPQSDIPIDETLRALDDLVHDGKVRYFGSSNFAAWKIVESLWAAKEYGMNRFVSEQAPYNLLERRVEREVAPMALTYDLALMAWSPLAGGFLTGKYRRGEPPPAGARIREGSDSARQSFTDKNFAVVETVAQLAHQRGCTASQLALAWCMSQPGIACPIIGPQTVQQLEDNLGAPDVKVTKEDRRRLDDVAPPGSALVPLYESVQSIYSADFGPNHFRW